jgi:hypothetical protein
MPWQYFNQVNKEGGQAVRSTGIHCFTGANTLGAVFSLYRKIVIVNQWGTGSTGKTLSL